MTAGNVQDVKESKPESYHKDTKTLRFGQTRKVLDCVVVVWVSLCAFVSWW
jgi:hypothetical protein